MIGRGDALLLIDLQRYYLNPRSDFYRYSEHYHRGAMRYIHQRWLTTVRPNVQELQAAFRAASAPLIYLRLCGSDPERSDLHPFFQESFRDGQERGYSDVYPLADQPDAGVADEIAPAVGEVIFAKTSFSGFHSGGLVDYLRETPEIQRLVIGGLATSQCVETTARDASDYGYRLVMIEDAMADYSETAHMASLFASQAVCGGDVRSTREYLHESEPELA